MGWFFITFSNTRTQRDSSEARAGSSQLCCLRPAPTALRRNRNSLPHPPGPAAHPSPPRAPARPHRPPSAARPQRGPRPAGPAGQSALGSAGAGQWEAAGGGPCGPSARPAGAASVRRALLEHRGWLCLQLLFRDDFRANTEITGHGWLNQCNPSLCLI